MLFSTETSMDDDDAEQFQELAYKIFTGEPQPAYTVALEPDEASVVPIDAKERSEIIVSILSIICSYGIKILFGDNFHPQNEEQIRKFNNHLKCIGWVAIFKPEIQNETITGIVISFESVKVI